VLILHSSVTYACRVTASCVACWSDLKRSRSSCARLLRLLFLVTARTCAPPVTPLTEGLGCGCNESVPRTAVFIHASLRIFPHGNCRGDTLWCSLRGHCCGCNILRMVLFTGSLDPPLLLRLVSQEAACRFLAEAFARFYCWCTGSDPECQPVSASVWDAVRVCGSFTRCNTRAV